MGLETMVFVTWRGERANARVHLDGAALRVGLRPAKTFALGDLSGQVRGQSLVLQTSDGELVLELGLDGKKWLNKITNRPSRLSKLGIAAGIRVLVVDVDDEELLAEVSASAASSVSGRGLADCILFGVHASKGLARLIKLKDRVSQSGGIWVIRTKGKAAAVRESDVRAAASEAGLVAVKTVSISETLTADRFVIPKAQRKG